MQGVPSLVGINESENDGDVSSASVDIFVQYMVDNCDHQSQTLDGSILFTSWV